MKRPVIFVALIVLIGGIAFLAYDVSQRRQEAREKLNNMKASLENIRDDVMSSQMELQRAVIAVTYQYDQCLSAEPTPAPDNALPAIGVQPPPGKLPFCLDADYLSFSKAHERYLRNLYEYNSLAIEINYKAAQLGEPPVLILELYQPAFR